MNMYLDDMNKNFDFDIARQNMLKGQILSCTQISADILNALEEIKRELFVIDKLKKFAFSDIRLELPHGQHMLKPLDEIRVLQELNITKTDKVLEIGTGSGYLTAILSKLASFVYSVEINQLNKQFANKNLSLSHCYNATIFLGNGLNGIPSVAPFDKIIITGAHHEIPDALKKQLKINGVMLAFLSINGLTRLVKINKINETDYKEQIICETNIDHLIEGGSHDVAKFIF